MNLGDLHFLARSLRDRAMAVPHVTNLNPPLLASEIAVLGHLSRHVDGARIGDIARGCLLAQSRVSTVVLRLKERGWVTTRAHATDTRTTVVSLRPKVVSGIRHFLQGDATALIRQMVPGASPSEKAAVVRGLTILLRELRGAEGTPVPANSPQSEAGS